MPSHPPDAALQAYLSGAVDERTKETVEQHCLVCSQCIERLIELTSRPAGATPAATPPRRGGSNARGAASVLALAAALTVVLLALPLLKQTGSPPSLRFALCGPRHEPSPVALSQALQGSGQTRICPAPRAGRILSTPTTSPYVWIGPKRPFIPPPPQREVIAEVRDLMTVPIEVHPPIDSPIVSRSDPLPPWRGRPKRNVFRRLFSTLASSFREPAQAESGI